MAHIAHPVHLPSVSINSAGVNPWTFVFFEYLISLFGHTEMHIPQLLHFVSSIIIFDIFMIITLNKK